LVADEASPRPSLKRKRLHILYILSDALHHADATNVSLATAGDATMPALVASAAAFENCPKHMRKLQALVDEYESEAAAASLVETPGMPSEREEARCASERHTS